MVSHLKHKKSQCRQLKLVITAAAVFTVIPVKRLH